MSAPLTVQLWPAARRLTLDGGALRVGALAGTLLAGLGCRVRQGVRPDDAPGAREAALSWLCEHDPFLRGVAAAVEAAGPHPPVAAPPGAGLLLSDDPAVVASGLPAGPLPAPGRVLWAAPADAVLHRPDVVPAALTVTGRDAEALRALGLDAVALLGDGPGTASAPSAGDGTSTEGVRPGAARPRVAVAVGVDLLPRLDAVLDAVTAAVAGLTGLRPRTTVLPDVAVGAGQAGTDLPVAVAPMHPLARSRAVHGADLVVALGAAAAVALDAAQAVSVGVPVLALAPEGAATPDAPPDATTDAPLDAPPGTALAAAVLAALAARGVPVRHDPAAVPAGTPAVDAVRTWLARRTSPTAPPESTR